MKHDLPPLDALKVFEAAARHLSFSLAADELCLTKGAVSYQIRKLEDQLSCALFRRATRQVYLTEAGQSLLKSTQQVFTELRQSFESLKTDHNSQVTVAVTTYVAVRWLSANIAGFNERYPNVSIMLQHTVNSADFKLPDVDMALRWSPSKQSSGPDRIMQATMPMFPVCSPALLEKLGYNAQVKLPREAMLQPPWCDITLLCEDRTQDFWTEWFEEQDDALINPRRTLSDANVRVQAAIDGQGWMLADELMRSELDNGLLVSPFDHGLNGYGYVLLCEPSRIVSRNAELLQQWLAEKLATSSQPDMLEHR
ncbi:LysR family transcriptional regulator [Aliamphritea hakodatensis]|uniref:LysR family transcriptional regulator n=1 Tax=Aliamphritea hakodatensis TaxID=2895352 RepID=UPI0022FD95A8|nr:LysR family transcriptional regulator [Aliamphritea hakodatensis]